MSQEVMHPLAASGVGNLVDLVRTYGCEPRFASRFARLLVLALAKTPLSWAAAAVYSGRTRRQTIAPPLFIIGHWRSGTTHLQNLMSEDPQFGRVTLLQAAMPHEFLLLPAALKKRLGAMLPSKRLMDNVPVGADVPREEELALTAVGRLSFYHVSFFPQAMSRIFREAVLFNGGDARLVATWQRQYVDSLRQVQYVQPGRPLLLKNPANTARIQLLRAMFPGARFIHLHRNPYKVFTSSVHLYLSAQEAWGLQATDRRQVVEHVLASYPELMCAYFAQRESLRPEELLEVDFKSVQERPLETLAAIYRHFELPGFAAAVPRFQAYLEGQRDYRKNQLPLADDERRQVAERWGDIFARLGYAV